MKMRPFLLSVVVVTGLALAQSAQAVGIGFTPPDFRDLDYRASYFNQSILDPIPMPAGSTKEVVVRFRNIGTETWPSQGPRYVSVYTMNSKYRASQFAHSSWIDNYNPNRVDQPTAPGEIGEFKITLKAPTKAGTYKEDFYLAAENHTWIKGGYFFLEIKVTPTEVVDAATNEPAPEEEPPAEVVSNDYRADLIGITRREIAAAGGQKINFHVLFYNSGDKDWGQYSWQEDNSRIFSGIAAEADIADQSWASADVVKVANQPTPTGKTLPIQFSFRAPTKKGAYQARFQLVADGEAVSGGNFKLPITVTTDAPADYQPPTFATSTVLVVAKKPRQLVAEPSIEVGLYEAKQPVQFKSDFDYRVYDGDLYRGVLPADQVAILNYQAGKYIFKSDLVGFSTIQPLSLRPLKPENHFTLTNYDRTVSWRGNKNFNSYRGALHYRYSPRKKAPYAVNRLPLDLYIAGIAETTNAAAEEYIKAILVAARSYGYFHMNNGLPKDKRSFDVRANTIDQLYLGYKHEAMSPRIAQAAEDTYGEMVTYQNEPVVTPYFANSDGQTRTWKQAWGGTNKPWLQPVVAKYDQGRALYGHGVGMSARDASFRASKDKWDYEKILGYYYTDTEVERIY